MSGFYNICILERYALIVEQLGGAGKCVCVCDKHRMWIHIHSHSCMWITHDLTSTTKPVNITHLSNVCVCVAIAVEHSSAIIIIKVYWIYPFPPKFPYTRRIPVLSHGSSNSSHPRQPLTCFLSLKDLHFLESQSFNVWDYTVLLFSPLLAYFGRAVMGLYFFFYLLSFVFSELSVSLPIILLVLCFLGLYKLSIC